MHLCVFHVRTSAGTRLTQEAGCVFNVASDFQMMHSLYLNHMQIALRHHATVKSELHAPD